MKGVKKAISEYRSAKKVGLNPHIILNRRSGEVHCDVVHGQDWRAYADGAYINLLNWAREVGYRIENVTMATVADLATVAINDYKED